MTGDHHDDPTEALVRAEEGRLFGLAYRMLGSAAEAEDALQEAFLRWTRTEQTVVERPAAWLTTTLTRICLDRLRSAQHRRESYVGEWLPAPIATDADPADAADVADSLTFAFLVVLESLSPLERAAFLLHDVFGHDFGEVARMLGRSPAAVRQLASRARSHVAARPTRQRADRAQARMVTEAFLAACAGDDLEAMMGVLAPDIVFIGDGGGQVPTVPAPVRGVDRVARMLQRFWRVGVRRGLSVEVIEVNSEPAIWVRDGARTDTILVLEVSDGRITAMRGVRNPDKLAVFQPTVRNGLPSVVAAD